MHKRKPNPGGQGALWVGGILVVLYLCLSWSTETAGIAPTPTPVVIRRDYDPPAPQSLELPAAAPRLNAVDAGGYPRIAKLWGGYDPSVGIDFYAQYDLLISQSFSDEQLVYLRGRNPAMITLYTGMGTYDLDNGPLGSQWIGATPGMPEYECFYRGTTGAVLRVPFWNHGMFNMGDDWCTAAIVDHLASEVGGRIGTVYDGVFFDRLHQAISPYVLDGIDLDHDGVVDDQDAVNERHWHGTEQFLDQVCQRLGQDAIVVGNDAPLFYASRLNGREYENFVRDIVDKGTDWTSFRRNYAQWMLASLEPQLTMVMGNPPAWLEDKFGAHPYVKMKPAVVDAAAAYYQRMRFGLTSALLEGGLYSFEFGTTWHGNAWWYDEYDGGGLGKGYLGAPLGPSYNALGPLTTPNVVQNPGFEGQGLSPWTLQLGGGAQAALDAVPISTTYALSGTSVARVTISASSLPQDVRLEQAGISLLDGQAYTLSFWGRATSQLWDVDTTLHAVGNTFIRYGLDETPKLGTAWQQYWIPFTADATVDTAVLSFGLGLYTGTVWIDDIRLQEGALPDVFRRDFEHGTVLVNATHGPQTVHLGATYQRISGSQAPAVRIILDDTDPATAEFAKWGGWAGVAAGYDQWGDTYHYALTTTEPWFVSSAIWRPSIPRAGDYDIYVWVAPHANWDDWVTYEVVHAGGTTAVALDPRVSEPGWVKLGTYALGVGTGNSVTLSNVSQSTWVVADAVKFESVMRYNDGTVVTAVTLAGQDGVVLLRHLDLPHRTYLPIVGRGG